MIIKLMNSYFSQKKFSAAIFVFLCILNISCVKDKNIQNYGPFFGITNNTKEIKIAIRKFNQSGNEFLLIVNASSLDTSIIKYNKNNLIEASFTDIRERCSNTNYVKALFLAEKNSDQIQNAGITRFSHLTNGVIVTADLCPSRRPLDKELFTEIIAKFKKPSPIALCVTGLWIEKHKNDLEWIKELEKKRLLNITWINHSNSHKYDRSLTLEKNFLLYKNTNIESEVLETEKNMLEHGLLPSVFFRFPGLVSNHALFLKITGYGLIPVGSDAWLAKNQFPVNGSIILIHANGNEPAGISRFINIIQNKKLSQKSWLLYDLRSSIINEL